jgi:hypothetical protein
MEARFTDRIKQIGVIRSLFLGQVVKFIPSSILENNVALHSIIAFSTCSIIIAVFSTTRSLTLFSLHPIFMTIGTLSFIAEGIVSFRNSSLLDILSPIMQHNKKMKVRKD